MRLSVFIRFVAMCVFHVCVYQLICVFLIFITAIASTERNVLEMLGFIFGHERLGNELYYFVTLKTF